jgi:hypothetical protein
MQNEIVKLASLGMKDVRPECPPRTFITTNRVGDLLALQHRCLPESLLFGSIEGQYGNESYSLFHCVSKMIGLIKFQLYRSHLGHPQK